MLRLGMLPCCENKFQVKRESVTTSKNLSIEPMDHGVLIVYNKNKKKEKRKKKKGKKKMMSWLDETHLWEKRKKMVSLGCCVLDPNSHT